MFDSNDTLAIKDIVTAASPFIKSIVDTFVTPKLVNINQKFSNKNQRPYIPTEQNFQEYLTRTYKRLSILNTIVFKNSQHFLKEIYIPLAIHPLNEKQEYLIDSYPENLIYEYGNILITDTAGMGKSTLLKRIFLDIIDSKIGIPLFIELRRLGKDKSLSHEIKEQLNSIDKTFDTSMLMELLAEGGFIILLDGYDEISLSDRDVVTKDIQDFITKASNNTFFLTSRPENALSSFGNFQELKIRPLKEKEAFELLRKFDKGREISKLLVKKLKEDKNLENIKEFLTNPLLVSLLFTAFEHKQIIPFKKYLFYRQVFDANFESHDLTKGESFIHDKYSKLEIDDFHKILRHIGFSCLMVEKIEFTKDEILKLISESKQYNAVIEFKESDFLSDILKTVPLFTKDGNYYRWSHKSLQEYFAAQFIYQDLKHQQNDILLQMFNHPSAEKFINILDLYFDVDNKNFRNVIEKAMLELYFEFIKNSETLNEIEEKYRIKRNEITFLKRSYIIKILPNDEDDYVSNAVADLIPDLNKTHVDYTITGVLIKPQICPNLYGLHFVHSKHILLNFLYGKKLPYFKKIHRVENLIIPGIDKIELVDRIPYEINNDPQDIFNKKSRFNYVTSFLKSTFVDEYSIDHEQATLALKKIKDEINFEDKNAFKIPR